MPRAKLRKGGKWHDQHRLCCVTHGMRVRLLQSGTVYTKAGTSEDTGWFNHSLRVTSWYLTTLECYSAQDCLTNELQQRLNQLLWYAGEGRLHGRCRCPRTAVVKPRATRRLSPGKQRHGVQASLSQAVASHLQDQKGHAGGSARGSPARRAR